MEIFIAVAVVIGVIFLMVFIGGNKTFDDPAPMENQHLLSAIAGQADWLEKMRASPLESQNSPSIIELTRKRKEYIAKLCMEAISRADRDDGPKYPGATRSINAFTEAAEYSKELEAKGASKENAAVRAVKEKMFIPNVGPMYPTRWEI